MCSIAMKVIQITMDEELLAQLDAADEVRQKGRSAVLRLAAAEYLRHRQRVTTLQQYRKAYAGQTGLGEEFEGWEDQGQWPRE